MSRSGKCCQHLNLGLNWTQGVKVKQCWTLSTNFLFLETLILESVNPQYDNRIQIVHWFTTSVREKYKFRACCVQKLLFVLAFKTIFVHNMFWTCNSMNNLLSYCGLTDARMRASEKDLPVFLISRGLHYWEMLALVACWTIMRLQF